MGNAGICRACGGSRVRWNGVRLVWCRCSGLWGVAPDPVRHGWVTLVPRDRWPAVRDRLLGRP